MSYIHQTSTLFHRILRMIVESMRGKNPWQCQRHSLGVAVFRTGVEPDIHILESRYHVVCKHMECQCHRCEVNRNIILRSLRFEMVPMTNFIIIFSVNSTSHHINFDNLIVTSMEKTFLSKNRTTKQTKLASQWFGL